MPWELRTRPDGAVELKRRELLQPGVTDVDSINTVIISIENGVYSVNIVRGGYFYGAVNYNSSEEVQRFLATVGIPEHGIPQNMRDAETIARVRPNVPYEPSPGIQNLVAFAAARRAGYGGSWDSWNFRSGSGSEGMPAPMERTQQTRPVFGYDSRRAQGESIPKPEANPEIQDILVEKKYTRDDIDSAMRYFQEMDLTEDQKKLFTADGEYTGTGDAMNKDAMNKYAAMRRYATEKGVHLIGKVEFEKYTELCCPVEFSLILDPVSYLGDIGVDAKGKPKPLQAFENTDNLSKLPKHPFTRRDVTNDRLVRNTDKQRQIIEFVSSERLRELVTEYRNRPEFKQSETLQSSSTGPRPKRS